MTSQDGFPFRLERQPDILSTRGGIYFRSVGIRARRYLCGVRSKKGRLINTSPIRGQSTTKYVRQPGLAGLAYEDAFHPYREDYGGLMGCATTTIHDGGQRRLSSVD